MKKVFKIILMAILICSVLMSLFFFVWLRPRYVVPILMYHNIDYGDTSLYLTPENFQKQMRFLYDHKYSVISLDELVEGIKSNRAFPRNTIVITFDDGYIDNLTNALPILDKYNFPATIFVSPGRVGIEDKLTWDQIRTMLKHTITIGAHTVNHVCVSDISNEKELRYELIECKKILEEQLAVEVNYFSFPIGGFTEHAQELLKEAGYKGACTTNRGLHKDNSDIYALQRVKMEKNIDNPVAYFVVFSGYYNVFRSVKHSH